ncbi:hypothetical protein [Litchfieldia alkalitelluris]|uniref:hypothetical protein n=1 Tax=Litchfieldia alkalitelluris TaxID=304268 RepID=UPI0009968A6E|nr:hypothetical protein [Litchfieldia alkalitelluris]
MVKKGIITYLLFLVLLSGCSSSVEDVVKDTQTVTEQTFQADPIKPNQTEDIFAFYLPEEMTVESAEDNNVILQKKEQLYILFVNPNEDQSSDVLYQSTIEATEQDIILNETYTDDSRFGYIKVEEVEDNSYQLSVGIGGVKLTTVTDLKNVKGDAEQMMQIVSSVSY